jgi:hypothetical protein
MANRKDSNNWIRKAARASLTTELTHSEMNDLLRRKKTAEQLKNERAPTDRKLTTDDIVAIAEAEKQHPMSEILRTMADEQPKTEEETDEKGE